MTELIDIIGNMSFFVVVFWSMLGSLYTVATAWHTEPENKEDRDTRNFAFAVGFANLLCSVILVLYFVNVVWRK